MTKQHVYKAAGVAPGYGFDIHTYREREGLFPNREGQQLRHGWVQVYGPQYRTATKAEACRVARVLVRSWAVTIRKSVIVKRYDRIVKRYATINEGRFE